MEKAITEAAIQRCSHKTVFWKYAANLQDNTHAEVRFQIKLLCNFIEIALRHGFSPVNLLPIFRTPFLKNTSGQLLLRLILPGIHVFWCKE